MFATSSRRVRCRRAHPIPHATYGLNEPRLAWIVTELTAHRRDVHIDRSIECLEIPIRDFEQQLLASLHAPCDAREREQQLVLDRGERQRDVTHGRTV